MGDGLPLGQELDVVHSGKVLGNSSSWQSFVLSEGYPGCILIVQSRKESTSKVKPNILLTRNCALN